MESEKEFRMSFSGNSRVQLVHRARARFFVQPPADETGAMPDAVAGHAIESYLNHQSRIERLPMLGAPGAPTARAAGRRSGETRRLDQLLQDRQQSAPVGVGEARCESHVMQLAAAIVETEQQR